MCILTIIRQQSIDLNSGWVDFGWRILQEKESNLACATNGNSARVFLPGGSGLCTLRPEPVLPPRKGSGTVEKGEIYIGCSFFELPAQMEKRAGWDLNPQPPIRPFFVDPNRVVIQLVEE